MDRKENEASKSRGEPAAPAQRASGAGMKARTSVRAGEAGWIQSLEGGHAVADVVSK